MEDGAPSPTPAERLWCGLGVRLGSLGGGGCACAGGGDDGDGDGDGDGGGDGGGGWGAAKHAAGLCKLACELCAVPQTQSVVLSHAAPSTDAR